MARLSTAILLGDYDSPHWHPVNDIDREIADIFQPDGVSVTFCQDYGGLSSEDLRRYDLVICYADCWKEKTSPQLVHAMLDYVSGGGSLLAIHNGIFMQEDFELAQMLGAKFTRHPEYTTLEYGPVEPGHPIVQDLDSWRMEEEPYQFTFDSFCPKTVFLEYIFEDITWPAGWTVEYGLGRIVYLAPGHDVRSFQNESFREVIRRSGRWARRQI